MGFYQTNPNAGWSAGGTNIMGDAHFGNGNNRGQRLLSMGDPRALEKQRRNAMFMQQLSHFGTPDQQYQKFLGLSDPQKYAFLYNGGAVNSMQQKSFENRWRQDLASQGKDPNQWINNTFQNGGMDSSKTAGYNIFNKPNGGQWGGMQPFKPQGGYGGPSGGMTPQGGTPMGVLGNMSANWKGFDNQGTDAPWGSPNAVQGIGGQYTPPQPANTPPPNTTPWQGGYGTRGGSDWVEQQKQNAYNNTGTDPGLANFRAGGLNGNFGGVSQDLHNFTTNPDGTSKFNGVGQSAVVGGGQRVGGVQQTEMNPGTTPSIGTAPTMGGDRRNTLPYAYSGGGPTRMMRAN